MVSLVANTTTNKGLEIVAELDDSKYETGIKVTDEEFESIFVEEDGAFAVPPGSCKQCPFS